MNVIVIAFGITSSNKIASVLQRLGISYIILGPNDVPTVNYTHVILSGGGHHVYELTSYKMPQWVMTTDRPVLGICYGMQLMAFTFGGSVIRMPQKEEGPVNVIEVINGRQQTITRWMNRFDQVTSVPIKFTITGVTKRQHIAAFTDNKKWWAVQYHPEADRYGDIEVIKRFLKKSPLVCWNQ